mmetsp:Transcript_31185/g.45613  ORF Transcript_31185/g.45613 Transcript_31185/m.45613 type:complete len:80 (+) Transcript_31185:433-672(+)
MLRRNAPQCTTLHHFVPQCTTVARTLQTLQNTATHCNPQQHTATHCNTLKLLQTLEAQEREATAENKGRREEERDREVS